MVLSPFLSYISFETRLFYIVLLVHPTLEHTFCAVWSTFCTSHSRAYVLHTFCAVWSMFCTSHSQAYILCYIEHFHSRAYILYCMEHFLHILLSGIHFVLYMEHFLHISLSNVHFVLYGALFAHLKIVHTTLALNFNCSSPDGPLQTAIVPDCNL